MKEFRLMKSKDNFYKIQEKTKNVWEDVPRFKLKNKYKRCRVAKAYCEQGDYSTIIYNFKDDAVFELERLKNNYREEKQSEWEEVKENEM